MPTNLLPSSTPLLTHLPLLEEYKKALDQFFVDNAKKIEKLDFSAKQVERIDHYVNHIPTSITLLKGGLKHARGDADKFTAIFEAVAYPSSPVGEYKKALNQFFVDNSEDVWKLNFSPEQIERINRYVDRNGTSTVLLKGRKKQEVCAAGVAALLSLELLPETTEGAI